MKAYLYHFGIYNLNNFAAYFMDYLIYGQIYKSIGWTTDFYEINFSPSDILCYDLNGFAGDPATGN